MVSKLEKIKRVTADEARLRLRQFLTRKAERIGVKSFVALPAASEIFSKPECSNYDPNALLSEFSVTAREKFYKSLERLDETIETMRSRFPDAAAEVVRAADKVYDGNIDLLGYDGLPLSAEDVDWHLDPVSGKSSPIVHWSRIDELSPAETGDKKVIWEINRHQYFTKLGIAYRLTGDEKYAITFDRLIGSWFDQNPPKIGVNWLSSLELAFRSISWVWAFGLFYGSPSIEAERFVTMMRFMALQGRHIEHYLSTYFSPNTHLTGEALGLYFIGSFLPETEKSRRWRKKGHRILLEALDFQVRPDGSYCEQSSHYHRYTADFYLSLLILEQARGAEVEPKLREKLEKLLDFLMHMTQPNGKTPLFGDEDGGRLHFFDSRPLDDFRSTLAAGAVVLRRGDLKFVAGDASAELLWLLGPEGLEVYDRLTAFEPKDKSKAFCDGGFFVARDSWKSDASYALFSCGPYGFLNGGHAHADELQVTMSIDGEAVLMDSGTFLYTTDPDARHSYRSSSAHNCLTVDGSSSSVPDGPFSWKTMTNASLVNWQEQDGRVEMRGAHDGYAYLGVNYEREVIFDGSGGVSLVDSVTSESERTFCLNFILAPDIEIRIENDRVEFSKPGRKDWALRAYAEVAGEGKGQKGRWSSVEHPVSTVYGKARNSNKLVFQLSGTGDIRIKTRFERT